MDRADPGTYVTAWRTELVDRIYEGDSGETAAKFHRIGGTLLYVDHEVVQGYDLHTGEPTWRYAESDRAIETVAIEQDVVVLDTVYSGNYTEERPHQVALDAGTGRLLWTHDDPEWRLTTDAAPGIVAMEWLADRGPAGAVEVSRLDAVTGEPRWTVKAEDLTDGCDPRPSPSSRASTRRQRDLLPVYLACQGDEKWQTRIAVALDPETGGLVWGSDAHVDLDTMVHGMARAHTMQGEFVLRDGRRVRLGKDYEDAGLYALGDSVALIADTTKTGSRSERVGLYGQLRVTYVDPDTGALTPGFSVRRPADPDALAPVVAGNAAYVAVLPADEHPGRKDPPYPVSVTDLTTRKSRLIGLPGPPVTVPSGRSIPEHWPTLILAGDLMVVENDGTLYASRNKTGTG